MKLIKVLTRKMPICYTTMKEQGLFSFLPMMTNLFNNDK